MMTRELRDVAKFDGIAGTSLPNYHVPGTADDRSPGASVGTWEVLFGHCRVATVFDSDVLSERADVVADIFHGLSCSVRWWDGVVAGPIAEALLSIEVEARSLLGRVTASEGLDVGSLDVEGGDVEGVDVGVGAWSGSGCRDSCVAWGRAVFPVSDRAVVVFDRVLV